MKSGITVTVDKVASVEAAARYLANTRVLVGVPEANTERRPEDGEKETGITNAELGYLHENGVPEKNIPARPWLFPTMRDHQDDVAARLKKVGELAFEGGGQPKAEQGLNALGLHAQSFIKQKLRTGPFAPLAPATLAARRRRGVTRTSPLIDTAQLLNSVTYVVRKVK